MTGRPPLWTPEEARADAEREGEREPELTRGQERAAGVLNGCVDDIWLWLLPCLLVGLFYWIG
ncbi:MAG: hypothetical protein ACJ8EB_12480 [Allosphingosinicella sp.]